MEHQEDVAISIVLRKHRHAFAQVFSNIAYRDHGYELRGKHIHDEEEDKEREVDDHHVLGHVAEPVLFQAVCCLGIGSRNLKHFPDVADRLVRLYDKRDGAGDHGSPRPSLKPCQRLGRCSTPLDVLPHTPDLAIEHAESGFERCPD